MSFPANSRLIHMHTKSILPILLVSGIAVLTLAASTSLTQTVGAMESASDTWTQGTAVLTAACTHNPAGGQICLPPDPSDLPPPPSTECIRPVPENLADPTGLVDGWPERTFEVAFAVDHEFVEAYGAGWTTVVADWIDGIDEFYHERINLRVVAADVHAHGPDVFTRTDANGRLQELRLHYLADHANVTREATHLFSGIDVSGVAGLANCIGGAGDNEIAYSISEGVGLDHDSTTGLVPNSDPYVKVAVHEIGHILSAHHHYANCAEAAPAHDTAFPQEACTVMFNMLNPLTLTMSSKNRLNTRGWTEFADL